MKPVEEAREASPSLTWCQRFKSGSVTLMKCGTPFKLDSGELCVEIPNKVIEDSKPLWKDFVIGQFYRKAPSFGKIKAVVNLMWSKWHRDVTMTKLEYANSFLFKIPNNAARDRVLKEGIWNIDGSTMFVAPWSPGVKPAIPELKTAPVWLELRKVPYELYNPSALSRIASLAGHLITEVDLHRPIPETVCARFESGEIVRVEVYCPHLPPICRICHEAGHPSKRCPKAPPFCNKCKNACHEEAVCPLVHKLKKPVKETMVRVGKPEANSTAGAELLVTTTPEKSATQPVQSGVSK
ncbi:hypothetical protein AALP_AA5G199700 [Arabis alpina]|uniref:DUF4283 domain-containing protein n=1 Tax=Arabis alpina TaxID=50452 RepID=A0A087GY87_ARAAL|nr:hypothetical protein AALP_AA5G199700 [Arabis alpina]